MVFMSFGSHHWRNRRNYIILSFDIVWIYLYDTQVTLQRHLLLFWASPSQLRVPRQGYKPQGVEVISELFIAIWHCSHVSGQMKSDFELQKAEKRAQFPCFEVMPSAITIIWPKKSRLRMLRSARSKSQHRGSIDQIKKCISATLKSRTPDFQVPKWSRRHL